MYPTPKANKVGTGGPHPFSGNEQEVNRLVKMIEHSRRTVGPDGQAVMFDAHCALPPPMLIQFANAIEPYDVLWIEEPAVPGNIEVFKRLKQQIRVPLATGERDRTNLGSDRLPDQQLHRHPPVRRRPHRRISQLRKIATLGETFHVPMAPHNTCSQLGLSASLHVSASIPLFLIQEGYIDGHIMPHGVARVKWTIDKDGYASLPEGPGLGRGDGRGGDGEGGGRSEAEVQVAGGHVSEDGSVRDY